MSLKALLKAGKELLRAQKPRATPATGQQPVQQARRIGDNNPPSPINTPKPSQQTGKELVTQELKNPPVVLKKTKTINSALNKLSKKMGGGMMMQRPMGYKSGTFVQARGCKLGRTRPTKIT